MKKYITRNEAAERAGVTPQTISNYIKRGLFGSVEQGRTVLIEEEAFDAFLSKYGCVVDAGRAVSELEKEIEERRKALEEEKDALEARIAMLKERGKFITLLNTGRFGELICSLTGNADDKTRSIIRDCMEGTSFTSQASFLGLKERDISRKFIKAYNAANRTIEEALAAKKENDELRKRVARQHEHIKMLSRHHNPNQQELDLVVWLKDTSVMEWLRQSGASVRLLNHFWLHDNIITMYDLDTRTQNSILGIDGIGKKSLYELEELLDGRGLKLGMTFEKK